MSTVWTKIQNVPSVIQRILPLNKYEFFACSFPRLQLDSTSNNCDAGILKYNSITHEWTRIMKYPENYESEWQVYTLDRVNNVIYLCDKDKRIIKFDLNTKTILEMQDLNDNCDVDNPFSIVISKRGVHFLTVKKHILLDHLNGSEVHTFEIPGIEAIIWPLMSVPMVTTYWEKDQTPKVVQFLDDCKWYICKISNTENLFASTIVRTTSRTHLIFIGGMDIKTQEAHSLIYFHDCKTRKLSQSNITLPLSLTSQIVTFSTPATPCVLMQAITTRDDTKDKILTYGFIRECYKIKSFKDTTKMPIYLMDYVFKWMCHETLHLFWLDEHWTIEVDKILSSD